MTSRHFAKPLCLVLVTMGAVLLLQSRAAGAPSLPWESVPVEQPPPKAEDDKTAVTYKEDARWRAIDFDPTKTVAGSALDFSRFLDAPAGRHGEVVSRDDEFQFKDEPGKSVRFYGVDLSLEANFPPDKAHAEMLADNLASAGYSAVRIHLYDLTLVPETDGKFDEVRRDQLNYLISCLRQRGIYYMVELYFMRPVKAGTVPGFGDFREDETMTLFPLSDALAENVEDFAKNLLCTPNAYIGLAMKDDPALISIEFFNEDSLFMRYVRKPAIKQYYEDKFQESLARRGKAAVAGKARDDLFSRWIVGLQEKNYTTLQSYLHGLGIDKPMTDLTIRFSYTETLARRILDYVDVHSYLALIKGLGAQKFLAPYEQNFTDCITARLREPLRVAACRLFGKAFACGEFSIEMPHPTRYFCVPETATLAGLQGWSAIYHYTYSHETDNIFSPHKAIRFDIVTDPGEMFGERIGSLLFAHGNVRPSGVRVPYVVTKGFLYSQLKPTGGVQYPSEYAELGAYCQIGTVILDKDTDLSGYPCVVVPPGMVLPPSMGHVRSVVADAALWTNLAKILPGLDRNHIVATTGQVDTDFRNGVFRTMTPQAESFLSSGPQKEVDGRTVSIRDNDSASVAFAGSLDGQALGESGRMLVLYLTDVQNTGAVIGSLPDGDGIIYSDGDLPRLARQGQAEFHFKTSRKDLPHVWALKYDGTRGVEITPQKTGDGFSFVAHAVTGRDSYFAYEIAWE